MTNKSSFSHNVAKSERSNARNSFRVEPLLLCHNVTDTLRMSKVKKYQCHLHKTQTGQASTFSLLIIIQSAENSVYFKALH